MSGFVHDMSKYQRLIAVDYPRITGSVIAVGGLEEQPGVTILSFDLTVWDEGKSSGRVLARNDFTAHVLDWEVDWMNVSERADADVAEVRTEIEQVMVAVAAEFENAITKEGVQQ